MPVGMDVSMQMSPLDGLPVEPRLGWTEKPDDPGMFADEGMNWGEVSAARANWTMFATASADSVVVYSDPIVVPEPTGGCVLLFMMAAMAIRRRR